METPLQYFKGVGPSTAKQLQKLSLETCRDLLYYFPRQYDDRRQLHSINQLTETETVAFVGTIQSIEETRPRKKMSILKCRLSDHTGSIVGIWFNQAYLKKLFEKGKKVFIKGKFERTLYNPEGQVSVSEFEVLTSTGCQTIGRVVPVYSLIPGLYQTKLRALIWNAVHTKLSGLKDPLPGTLKKELNLIPLEKAISAMHFPSTLEDYQQARYRLVFDEFFYFQLSIAQKQQALKSNLNAYPLETQGDYIQQHLEKLPYTLTGAQQRVVGDIQRDVQKSSAMNRLIQGDVGSGKTDVAILALLFAIQTGKKGVMMAPTEILADQHFYKLSRDLASLGIPVYLLKSKIKKKEKDQILKAVSEPGPALIVGTHALIQDQVKIVDIGLVVVDEQHRFGVDQRLALREKAYQPHCLFMTATPIPRSLMLTSFGDLDKSTIDEMPPGRTPPETVYMKPSSLHKVYTYCQQIIQKGQQVYIVFPLIEESEKLDLEAAIDNYEQLKSQEFNHCEVGLIHGRLPAKEKVEIMDRFKSGEIQVLVSTTVIEVGIDVPNATVMVIHHAERFGLSQLHQLRGRVGRGATTSTCFLISTPKTDTAKERVKAMVDSSDGFKLAQVDLMLRGPGDMLGKRQSGLPDFQLAHLVNDEKILLAARVKAFEISKSDPQLNNEEHREIKSQMARETLSMAKGQLN